MNNDIELPNIRWKQKFRFEQKNKKKRRRVLTRHIQHK
jgi:hypothetical protein